MHQQLLAHSCTVQNNDHNTHKFIPQLIISSPRHDPQLHQLMTLPSYLLLIYVTTPLDPSISLVIHSRHQLAIHLPLVLIVQPLHSNNLRRCPVLLCRKRKPPVVFTMIYWRIKLISSKSERWNNFSTMVIRFTDRKRSFPQLEKFV